MPGSLLLFANAVCYVAGLVGTRGAAGMGPIPGDEVLARKPRRDRRKRAGYVRNGHAAVRPRRVRGIPGVACFAKFIFQPMPRATLFSPPRAAIG
ncbi:hypothetical protein OJF2_33240 [Aquisphaera giovannonii]|uniref:Uncharacterized protein n=1 Tax=Aquisphaera giovannonii TaxID=406548 RepID=A0A5B9W279_9BACT|nr:hypothetical protein OJF2_33240 [Aquisphaera giovannonii]